jgi:hypothetical protein
MTVARIPKVRINYGFTKEVLAIIISIISFVVSILGFYTSSLKAPDLHFYTAPYIRHVVDESSRNEAFFIPLTLANRGARQGTLVSVDLTVAFLADSSTQHYFGQYFAQDGAQDIIGGFFTPMALNGYSADTRTVCFYPLGAQAGNFFVRPGVYEFRLLGTTANVRGESAQIVSDIFRAVITEEMAADMHSQPDGEYRFPIPIKHMP